MFNLLSWQDRKCHNGPNEVICWWMVDEVHRSIVFFVCRVIPLHRVFISTVNMTTHVTATLSGPLNRLPNETIAAVLPQPLIVTPPPLLSCCQQLNSSIMPEDSAGVHDKRILEFMHGLCACYSSYASSVEREVELLQVVGLRVVADTGSTDHPRREQFTKIVDDYHDAFDESTGARSSGVAPFTISALQTGRSCHQFGSRPGFGGRRRSLWCPKWTLLRCRR